LRLNVDQAFKVPIRWHTLDASHLLRSTTSEYNADHQQPADDRVDSFLKAHKTSKLPIIPHPCFWDGTGDIILQVASTLFRVHGSSLTHHSPLFAGLVYKELKCDTDGVLYCSVPGWVNVTDMEVLFNTMENAVCVMTIARCDLLFIFIVADITSNHHPLDMLRPCYVPLLSLIFLNSGNFVYTA
jgi:hypothetical protein